MIKLMITASTIITAPSTINRSQEHRGSLNSAYTKCVHQNDRNNNESGMTEATNNPARKISQEEYQDKHYDQCPFDQILTTVLIALFTIFVLSRNGSITIPSGRVFRICSIRSFTFLITSLLLAPFNIMTTAPETSPSSL